MESRYVSLGFQCTVSTVFENMNVKTETLPFDWMLSSPKFVYEMIFLLLSNNLSIEEIVRNHFFYCTKRSSILKHNDIATVEHYVEDINGDSLYNEKYKVIFPHDHFDEENIQKYIRRFERLKYILTNDEPTIFTYISPSSQSKGNFLINDILIIDNTYYYISKIYEMISYYRNNFKFCVLDSDTSTNKNTLNNNIILYNIEPKEVWLHIVKECEDKLKLI